MPITSHFYNGSIRKAMVAFGTLFNGITIVRDDGNIIDVPFAYGSKNKWLTMLNQDPDKDTQTAITLPRMSFVVTGFPFDTERKQPSLSHITGTAVDPTTNASKMYLPVPYDIDITVSIMVKSMSDGLQIVEQILPFFKPSFNITINEIGNPDIKRDLPIILNTAVLMDETEGGFDGFRAITWDLDFSVKMNLYGPPRDAKIIREVTVNTTVNSTDQALGTVEGGPDVTQTVTPDPIDAVATDDYGFTETIVDNKI